VTRFRLDRVDRHEPRAFRGVCGEGEGIQRVGKEWGKACQGVALPRSAPGLSCSRAPALQGWGSGPCVVISVILLAPAASCSTLPAAQGCYIGMPSFLCRSKREAAVSSILV
jgi:hypothetical protein